MIDNVKTKKKKIRENKMRHTLIAALCLCVALAAFVGAVTAAQDTASLTAIMGGGSLSAEEMFALLKQNNKKDGLNPLSDYQIKSFVMYIISEAQQEGVNRDVVFALIMHETGFLNFGGDVKPEQNNFGGLGATGGGVAGAVFPDTATGIRAVVQHLKCYATDTALNNPCVDPRFTEKLRLVAPYVEWLGKADNPYNIGWASPGAGYGLRLTALIERASSVDTTGVNLSKIKDDTADSALQEPVLNNNSYIRATGLILMLYCVSKWLKLKEKRA